MSGKAFGHRSAKHNGFPTHYSMTEQLLEKEFFNPGASTLEPACGNDEAIVKVLKKHNFSNLDYYDIEHDNDFYRADFYKEDRKFPYIITNPPYGTEADKFVMKAKEVCTVKFAMLLRTNYLSGALRLKQGIYEWLKTVYIFSRMPELSPVITRKIKGEEVSIPNPLREDGKYHTAMIVYAWMVWEIGFTGKPITDWIDNQRYVLRKGD